MHRLLGISPPREGLWKLLRSLGRGWGWAAPGCGSKFPSPEGRELQGPAEDGREDLSGDPGCRVCRREWTQEGGLAIQ